MQLLFFCVRGVYKILHMECRRGSLFTELADLIVETFQPSRLIIFMYQREYSIPPFLESCQLLNFTICTVHVLCISEGGGD